MKLASPVLLALGLTAASPLPAATATWDGGGNNNNWGTPNNWNPDGVPTFDNTLDVVLTGTLRPSQALPGTLTDVTIRSLTFDSNTNFEVRTASAVSGGDPITLTFSADAGNAALNTTTGTTGAHRIYGPDPADIILASDLDISHASSGTLTLERPLTESGGARNVTLLAGSNTVRTDQANTFTGTLRLAGGSWLTTNIANGGAASGLGQSSAAAASLVLDGGTLEYDGPAATTDRLFTLGTGGGSIIKRLAGALEFTSTGAVAFEGSGPRQLTLGGGSGATQVFNPALADGPGGATSLVKTGLTTWQLTNTNSFSGGVTFNQGTLVAGPANIGSGTVTMAATSTAATWLLTGGTVDNEIIFADGATGNKIINLADGVTDAELAGTITFADDSTTNSTSRISPSSGTIVISGLMTGTGTGGYAKRNTGTVVITNTANDYAGPTNIVDAGTLIVDGTVPGNLFFGENLDGSSTSFGNGTLAGSGTVAGNVGTRGGSNISPGGSSSGGVNAHTVATLSIGGNLDISLPAAGAGLITMQLGTSSDLVSLFSSGGVLTIGTDALGIGDFAFIEESGFASDGIGSSYTLISTNNPVAGSLNPADLTGTVGAWPVELGFSTDGTDLVLTVVPEPSAALLAGLAALTTIAARRRRR